MSEPPRGYIRVPLMVGDDVVLVKASSITIVRWQWVGAIKRADHLATFITVGDPNANGSQSFVSSLTMEQVENAIRDAIESERER